MRQAKGDRLGNARLRFYSILSSLTFLCWLSSAHAFSSLVCVTTPAELQTALTNAETATLPTVIEVTAGTYPINSTLTYSGSAISALTIQGGYTGSLESGLCSKQTPDASLTILDGQNANAIMSLQTFSSQLTVKYLTFKNALGSSDVTEASALFAGQRGSDSGAVDVSNNIFSGNTETQGGAGILNVETQGDITLLSNVIVNNMIGVGYGLIIYAGGSGSSTAVNNNTISANACSAGSGGTAPGTAASIGTYGSQVSVANNIVYGNVGCQNDLYLNSGTAQASFAINNNDLGDLEFPNSGGGASTEKENQTTDPLFANGRFSLSPSSTLVNSGDNSPLGGVGALDAAGNTRVVFDTVDVGAYELQDDIFKNGFD